MRAKDVVIGQVYAARVAGKRTLVRIDRESPYSGTKGWIGTNVKTGREVRIKTAGRLTPVD